jgi:uncharacterized protein
MTRYFADTFYFLALLNPDDSAHEQVEAFTASFDGAFTTTDWVLTEVADAMSGVADRGRFLDFYAFLRGRANVRVIRASSTWFDRGLELFARRSDKEWSLTDCISICIMQHEHLHDALTADRHFEQAGCRCVFKRPS